MSRIFKGTPVEYRTIHYWVVKQLGKADCCENCNSSKPDEYISYFQWANISGEYKKDISDWAKLCVQCHKLFDGKALKSICRRGHIITPDNIYSYPNKHSRECLACKKYDRKVHYQIEKVDLVHLARKSEMQKIRYKKKKKEQPNV